MMTVVTLLLSTFNDLIPISFFPFKKEILLHNVGHLELLALLHGCVTGIWHMALTLKPQRNMIFVSSIDDKAIYAPNTCGLTV